MRAPGQLIIALPSVAAAFLSSFYHATTADACWLSDMAYRDVDTALLHAHAHAIIRASAFCGVSADALRLTFTRILDLMATG